MLYYPCTLRVSIALVVCLPLSGLETPTAVFFYMKILAYLNEKCNSNRCFISRLPVVVAPFPVGGAPPGLRRWDLVSVTILALATLGFDLATLDLSAAAVRIIQNYSFV